MTVPEVLGLVAASLLAGALGGAYAVVRAGRHVFRCQAPRCASLRARIFAALGAGQ